MESTTVRSFGARPQRRGEDGEIEGHPEESEPGDEEPGDRSGAEREFEAAGERADRRLRGAHIGAHRYVHADEPGRARQNGANGKADAHQPAEEIADDDEDHDADDADRRVLPPQIGLRALAYRRSYLLHPLALPGSACITENVAHMA